MVIRGSNPGLVGGGSWQLAETHYNLNSARLANLVSCRRFTKFTKFAMFTKPEQNKHLSFRTQLVVVEKFFQLLV